MSRGPDSRGEQQPQASGSASGCDSAGGNGDCSGSEGYATSLGSSAGSDTLSLASDCDSALHADEASTDSDLRRSSWQMDSLTLALEEIRAGERRTSRGSNFFVTHQLMGGPTAPGEAKVEEEFPDLQKPNKRSSSLKSKKTPPETPNQMKKAVRFADAFGLDLTYVKHVFDLDNPPEIPPQATQDLDLADEDSLPPQSPSSSGQETIFVSPCFAQPGASANFMSRVMAQKVVLESAAVSGSDAIAGVVRVSNLGFEKLVIVRATFDNWSSCSDVSAEYVENSSNGLTDQFRFRLPLPATMRVGDKAAFCVMYSVGSETLWDNNFGENYVFDCFALNQAAPAEAARR